MPSPAHTPSASAMLRASYVRVFAPRKAVLSFDQHGSIGDMSGESGGKY